MVLVIDAIDDEFTCGVFWCALAKLIIYNPIEWSRLPITNLVILFSKASFLVGRTLYHVLQMYSRCKIFLTSHS